MSAPNYSMFSLLLQLNCNSGDQHSSSTTAAAGENCSLTDVFGRRWPAELHTSLLQISTIYLSHSKFYIRDAQWNTAASVLRIHFVIWSDFVMCLLSWELGTDANMQNITFVSVVQHSRCLFVFFFSCFCHTLLPNVTPLFSIPSNLASAHHHRDLELAPMVARQQWHEAFSFNYVRVSGSRFVLYLVRAVTYSNSCTEKSMWLFSSVYSLSSSKCVCSQLNFVFGSRFFYTS